MNRQTLSVLAALFGGMAGAPFFLGGVITGLILGPGIPIPSAVPSPFAYAPLFAHSVLGLIGGVVVGSWIYNRVMEEPKEGPGDEPAKHP